MRVSVVGRSVRQRGLSAIHTVGGKADDKADAVLLNGCERFVRGEVHGKARSHCRGGGQGKNLGGSARRRSGNHPGPGGSDQGHLCSPQGPPASGKAAFRFWTGSQGKGVFGPASRLS